MDRAVRAENVRIGPTSPHRERCIEVDARPRGIADAVDLARGSRYRSPRVASRRTETLREAAAALDSGDFRRAIQLSEQVRSLERVSGAELVQIFGLLGRAYVGLGENETALSYLRRADRDTQTVAATRRAFEALGYEDDPSFFEQADARAKKKSVRRLLLLGAAVVLVPVVLVCGGIIYVIGSAYSTGADMSAGYARAVQEGAARGRAGNVGDCVGHAMHEMAQCAPELGSTTPTSACIAYSAGYEACVGSTEWREFCASVPPPALHEDGARSDGPQPLADPWVEAECERGAARAGLTGQALSSFQLLCDGLLGDLPAQCATPSLRPTFDAEDVAP